MKLSPAALALVAALTFAPPAFTTDYLVGGDTGCEVDSIVFAEQVLEDRTTPAGIELVVGDVLHHCLSDEGTPRQFMTSTLGRNVAAPVEVDAPPASVPMIPLEPAIPTHPDEDDDEDDDDDDDDDNGGPGNGGGPNCDKGKKKGNPHCN